MDLRAANAGAKSSSAFGPSMSLLEAGLDSSPLPISLDLIEPLGSEALLHAKIGDAPMVIKAETHGRDRIISRLSSDVHVKPASMVQVFRCRNRARHRCGQSGSSVSDRADIPRALPKRPAHDRADLAVGPSQAGMADLRDACPGHHLVHRFPLQADVRAADRLQGLLDLSRRRGQPLGWLRALSDPVLERPVHPRRSGTRSRSAR